MFIYSFGEYQQGAAISDIYKCRHGGERYAVNVDLYLSVNYLGRSGVISLD